MVTQTCATTIINIELFLVAILYLGVAGGLVIYLYWSEQRASTALGHCRQNVVATKLIEKCYFTYYPQNSLYPTITAHTVCDFLSYYFSHRSCCRSVLKFYIRALRDQRNNTLPLKEKEKRKKYGTTNSIKLTLQVWFKWSNRAPKPCLKKACTLK